MKYLDELKKLNLPKDRFAIFGSGPLAIRNIMENRDVDVIAKPLLWNELIEKFSAGSNDAKSIQTGHIEIWKEWKPFSEGELIAFIDTADVIGDLRFVKLENVLKWKNYRNEEKDRRDIELINEFLKSRKVVICASESFYKEAEKWKGKLESEGFSVIRSVGVIERTMEAYKETHTEHYRKITETDILFVINIEKNGIPNYIGASVFAEVAFAIGLNITSGKKIEVFCLNPLPESLPYSDELKKWEELGWIKLWKL